MSSFKDQHVYYTANYQAAWFVYNLLWWLILISISVALVNMLPMGIFDGGRFFYLTILGITGSKTKAMKTFKVVTWFLLLLLIVIMAAWVFNIF